MEPAASRTRASRSRARWGRRSRVRRGSARASYRPSRRARGARPGRLVATADAGGPQLLEQPAVPGLDVAEDPLGLTLERGGELVQAAADHLRLFEHLVGGLLGALDALIRLLARDLPDPHGLGLRLLLGTRRVALGILARALGLALDVALALARVALRLRGDLGGGVLRGRDDRRDLARGDLGGRQRWALGAHAGCPSS